MDLKLRLETPGHAAMELVAEAGPSARESSKEDKKENKKTVN